MHNLLIPNIVIWVCQTHADITVKSVVCAVLWLLIVCNSCLLANPPPPDHVSLTQEGGFSAHSIRICSTYIIKDHGDIIIH